MTGKNCGKKMDKSKGDDKRMPMKKMMKKTPKKGKK